MNISIGGSTLIFLPLLVSGLVLLGLGLYFPYLLAALGLAFVLLLALIALGFWWFRRRWRRILEQADQAFTRATEAASEPQTPAAGPVIYVQAQEVKQQGQNDS
ncbi:MAG: hypothetical protein IGS03_10855 [Candidatus Sericytochromatia bacterium]|nr:hypothetical protein [Candidatus Sericytochromatia bacterium]